MLPAVRYDYYKTGLTRDVRSDAPIPRRQPSGLGDKRRFVGRGPREAMGVRHLLRGKQDEQTYCLTGGCSRDIKALPHRARSRCLTDLQPIHSSLFLILNQCLLRSACGIVCDA